jgi:hypothetical protein
MIAITTNSSIKVKPARRESERIGDASVGDGNDPIKPKIASLRRNLKRLQVRRTVLHGRGEGGLCGVTVLRGELVLRVLLLPRVRRVPRHQNDVLAGRRALAERVRAERERAVGLNRPGRRRGGLPVFPLRLKYKIEFLASRNRRGSDDGETRDAVEKNGHTSYNLALISHTSKLPQGCQFRILVWRDVPGFSVDKCRIFSDPFD